MRLSRSVRTRTSPFVRSGPVRVGDGGDESSVRSNCLGSHRERGAEFRSEIPSGWILPSAELMVGVCAVDQGSATRLNRNALAITDTDDRLIAALAIIGESTHPKNG